MRLAVCLDFGSELLLVVDLKFAMAAVCQCDWVGNASMYVLV